MNKIITFENSIGFRFPLEITRDVRNSASEAHRFIHNFLTEFDLVKGAIEIIDDSDKTTIKAPIFM